MTTKLKRYMVCLTPYMEERINGLKAVQFTNKSYSDVVRYLIDLGITGHDNHMKLEQRRKKHDVAE